MDEPARQHGISDPRFNDAFVNTLREYDERLRNGDSPTDTSTNTSREGIESCLEALQVLERLWPRSNPSSAGATIPERLGRFRIERVVGQGGFGIVYLGFDEELHRQVAIKVPTKARFQKPQDAEAYLAEARIVASLDHPHIVPVYDMGRTADDSIYVVSKFIEGSTLEDLIREWNRHHTRSRSRETSVGILTDSTAAEQRRDTVGSYEREATQLLVTVALALQHAHDRRLIHRDIKPANILLESKSNAPYVADFGLAIREEHYLNQNAIAGTPAYMSPEQIRGEGHRLDGRSDIFSLGVILYELLTGRKPFGGSSTQETLHLVLSQEPRPPRELVDTIPAELERICLKALSKRTSDRYATAAEFADDLAHWLKAAAAVTQAKAAVPVIPKGLRSFDANDADFFPDLLPGQRNRDGLPESIAFWKQRIEQTDSEQTFSVGLIYGPSGCGKSSLVKAGLLPGLSKDVIVVYLEATPDETELRILRGLRKQIPNLDTDNPLLVRSPDFSRNPASTPADAPPEDGTTNIVQSPSLSETLLHLRRNHQQKVVIIIDQFEQWLHSHRAEPDAELVKALRQCDGGRLQAILIIRDDFYVAALRLMQALDIDLVPGRNFLFVDLFDVEHARKVLIRFGQAFGKLPANAADLSMDEDRFVTSVASGLAENGKVVSVRLSLMAEMVKARPWKPETLRQVGGTAGIGVSFLEETFCSLHADLRFRRHSAAARGVLKALLPELDTDIKGSIRSHAALLEASGYQDRPADFADLLRILDGELRLITPTDPEGKDEGGGLKEEGKASPAAVDSSFSLHPSSFRYYQLTHDYLVPSLREWLTRKQKETRQGRAELKLSERSSLWNARPENRFLPSLVEWLNIRTLTNRKRWTEPQRGMIRRADRFHLSRLTTAVVLLALITATSLLTWHRVDQNRRELLAQKAKEQEATRIEGLVGRLEIAEPDQLPGVIAELDANSEIAATYLLPLLTQQSETLDEKRSQLHARLASVSRDPSLVEPLLEELLTSKVTYIGPIRQQLRPYASQLTRQLWSILRDDRVADRRFRAALALADFVAESEAASWSDEDLKFVAQHLVSANAEFQPLLRENFRPIHRRLLPDLESIFGDPTANDAQRLSAANAFADYAASDIAKLSELLTVATPEQYAVLYPIVAASPGPAIVEDLGKFAATLPPVDMGSVERVPYGQRRANAAVTLLRLGEREKVFPVFEMTDDPEALTQFIFRCRDRDVRVEELLECLRIVSDGPVDRFPRNTRYALLLALGEYALAEIPESQQASLLTQLGDWYRDDPSSGVHGATGWLLRKWGQAEIVRTVDQTPVPYSEDREWFTLAITVTPTSPPKPAEKPADENAVPEAETKTSSPAEDAASEDEGTEKKDELDSTEPAKDEARPEPPPEPLPPRTFYYTFIVFPPGESLIGSVEDEPERPKRRVSELRHVVKLTRPFALLDREVTLEELIANSPTYVRTMHEFNAQPSDAGFTVNWYHSVGCCTWLSQESGLSDSDQSYAHPESLDKDQFPRETDPRANWAPRNWPLELGRRGFRLPTEAEWEVACRAGARTTYGYGSEASFLGRFGWSKENSGGHVHPPKGLRPTMRGLFDLHGNLAEWTHDWSNNFGEDAMTDPVGPQGGFFRVLRGGAWSLDAATCRSADRKGLSPATMDWSCGFRLALSLPSGVSSPAEQGQGAGPAGEGTEGGKEGASR